MASAIDEAVKGAKAPALAALHESNTQHGNLAGLTR